MKTSEKYPEAFYEDPKSFEPCLFCETERDLKSTYINLCSQIYFYDSCIIKIPKDQDIFSINTLVKEHYNKNEGEIYGEKILRYIYSIGEIIEFVISTDGKVIEIREPRKVTLYDMLTAEKVINIIFKNKEPFIKVATRVYDERQKEEEKKEVSRYVPKPSDLYKHLHLEDNLGYFEYLNYFEHFRFIKEFILENLYLFEDIEKEVKNHIEKITNLFNSDDNLFHPFVYVETSKRPTSNVVAAALIGNNLQVRETDVLKFMPKKLQLLKAKSWARHYSGYAKKKIPMFGKVVSIISKFSRRSAIEIKPDGEIIRES